MSTFEVSTESLQTGAAYMQPGQPIPGVVTELSPGAAAGTPAASAWSDTALTANGLATQSNIAIEDLVGALDTAANAYAIADQSAAASLSPGQ